MLITQSEIFLQVKRSESQTRQSAVQKSVKCTLLSTSADKHTYSTQCVCTQGGNDDERGRVKEMFVCPRGRKEGVSVGKKKKIFKGN